MTTLFSVALATHNGARYLPDFLDSLLGQRQLPDELIASDDASNDDTLNILESFATRAPFPVRIRLNRVALGVRANFEQAISRCSCTFIALADQDDFWHPLKLEKLAHVLSTSNVLATFSDAEVVDENLKPLGYTMWQRIHFTRREQSRTARGEAFAVLLKHHIVTGATLAFRANLSRIALPIPDSWPHDAWLAQIAAAQGSIYAIAEPLIAYRQHDNNVIGGARKSLFQEVSSALSLNRSNWYAEELLRWRTLAERLGTSAPIELSEKIAHLERRHQLPNSRWRRLPGIAKEIFSGGYLRYARNWGSAAIDLTIK